MDRAKLLIARLLRLNPSKAFLLGAGLMLLMPESLYSSLALSYHDIAHDNTYTLEGPALQSAQPQPRAPASSLPEQRPAPRLAESASRESK